MYHGMGSATIGSVGGVGGISTLAYTGTDPLGLLYAGSAAVVLVFAGLAIRKIVSRPHHQ